MNGFNKWNWLFAAAFGLATSLNLVACGDDDDTAGTGDDDDNGDTGSATDGATDGATDITGDPTDSISKAIKASEGGSVALGAKAAVNIPAGALPADVDVSVKEFPKAGQPDAANLGSNVFDFGPDGTKFSKPVTLTLEFKGTVPEGKKATIAFLENGKWEVLADSKVSDGKVVASTNHFTPFVVFFNGSGEQTGGQCGEGFTACGGDLAGTWTYAAACLTLAPETADPIEGCPEASFGAEIDVDGTVTFNGDGTAAIDQTVSITTSLRYPKACLTAQGLPAGTPCTQLFEEDKPGKTVTEAADACFVNEQQEPKLNKKSGTWSATGNDFTVQFEGDDAPSTGTYCVKGREGTFRVEQDKGQIVQYTATKN
jgi:hypothetical protein